MHVHVHVHVNDPLSNTGLISFIQVVICKCIKLIWISGFSPHWPVLVKGRPAKLFKFTTFTYILAVVHYIQMAIYRTSWFMVVLWALPITTNFIVIPAYKSITMTFVVGLYLHISSFTTSQSFRGEPRYINYANMKLMPVPFVLLLPALTTTNY